MVVDSVVVEMVEGKVEGRVTEEKAIVMEAEEV